MNKYTVYLRPAVDDPFQHLTAHPYANWCVSRVDWEVVRQDEQGRDVWACTVTPLPGHPQSYARLLPDGSVEIRLPRIEPYEDDQ